MIAFLEGTLAEKQPTRILLNVAGVGYEVLIPLSSYDRLPAADAACRILTYDYVREDTHQLFGFMTEEERRLFLLLMTVSGIGPKLALTALSGLSVRELKAAISQGDAARLSSISGIGKKTADRIIVDLRNKVGKAEGLAAGEPAAGPDDMKMRDAVLALISLGYKRAEAQKMVQDVVSSEGTDKDVETIIRKALAK